MSVVLSMERSDDISVSIDIYAYCELADVCATFHRMSHGITLNMEVECEQQMQDLQDEELGDSRHTDRSDHAGLRGTGDEGASTASRTVKVDDTSLEQPLTKSREPAPTNDHDGVTPEEGVSSVGVHSSDDTHTPISEVKQHEMHFEDCMSGHKRDDEKADMLSKGQDVVDDTGTRRGRDNEVRKPLTFIKVHTT